MKKLLHMIFISTMFSFNILMFLFIGTAKWKYSLLGWAISLGMAYITKEGD